MKSITTINGLKTLLLVIINTGGIGRIIFCCIYMMHSDMHEGHQMKKRIIHTIIFLAIANCIGALNSLAEFYWR